MPTPDTEYNAATRIIALAAVLPGSRSLDGGAGVRDCRRDWLYGRPAAISRDTSPATNFYPTFKEFW
jgi:hypothetical protein